jgi:hypothetical protein
MAGKLPPRAVIEAAVKAMQLYLGIACDPRARLSDERKLRSRVDRKVDVIVKSTGNTSDNVWGQLENEARRRGKICPLPGKDI